MSFNRVADGNVAYASDIDQVIDALQGVTGKGQPVSLTSLSDAINYAISLKNLDATNSRAVAVYGADGNPLLTVDKNGVQASGYGTNSLARVLTRGDAGVITSTNLAAGAATLLTGISDNANQSTTSTTFVQIPTMITASFTTIGGDLLVWAQGVFFESASGNVAALGLQLDSGGFVPVARFSAGASSAVFPLFGLWRFTGVSAGAHTVSMGWGTSAGTLSTDANTPVPSRILEVLELRR